MYSATVRRLVSELPNRGELPDATHVAEAGNPVCGDVTRLYLKVEEGVVQDCRFQTQGCPGAIAAAAALTLLVKNRAWLECLQLEASDLLEYLEGLPSHKVHGVDLAISVLRQAAQSPRTA